MKPSISPGRLAGLALAAAVVMTPSTARAAGLYFQDRGVRPLARGGAFVAGADDLGAIYYNPAGIVFAPNQLLLDASWLRFSSSFERTANVTPRDPNTGQPGPPHPVTLGKVEGSSPILPLPTLAGSYALSDKLVLTAGVYAPYAAITSYPERVGGQPAPQRYSLLSLDGSALAIVGAFVAYKPSEHFAIGLGPTLLAGTFQSTIMFGACPPDRLACAAEQPEYDAKAQLSVGPIRALSATVGAVAIPADAVRIGASFQLPYTVDAAAKFKTQLPPAPIFDSAYVDGEDARVTFKLPWIARVGVEVRPTPRTRVEAAFVYEKWSMHDAITVTPDDTVLRNVAVFPPAYRVGAMRLERHFQDAYSLRLGGEQTVHLGRYGFDLRAGLAYEKSAVPPAYLSVLTVDMDKITAAVGGGLHVGERWRFDGLVAVVFPKTVTVSNGEAALYKVNPVRANRREGDEVPVNAGTYTARALVLGMGLTYRFGEPARPPTEPPELPNPPEEPTDDPSKDP